MAKQPILIAVICPTYPALHHQSALPRQLSPLVACNHGPISRLLPHTYAQPLCLMANGYCRNRLLISIRMEFLTSLSEWGYAGLFIAAFLAGSILPFSSEVVLGLLLVAGYSTWGCVVSATAGNWLGGITCYYIGRLGKTAWIEKYLKLSHEKLDKTQRFLQGKGSLMGFFAFVPGVGDAIVVALWLMRANLWGVALSMLLGKGIRYYLIAIGVEWIV